MDCGLHLQGEGVRGLVDNEALGIDRVLAWTERTAVESHRYELEILAVEHERTHAAVTAVGCAELEGRFDPGHFRSEIELERHRLDLIIRWAVVCAVDSLGWSGRLGRCIGHAGRSCGR